MAKLLPIEQVTPDIDNTVVRVVFNPLNVDFVHDFASRPITLKAGEFNMLPSPVARHMAKHLAIKMRHENVMDYLQKNIKGMGEDSIEKWKRETKFMVTKDDVNLIMDQILFGSIEEAHAKFGMEVEQPEMAKEAENDVLTAPQGAKQPSAGDVAAQIKKRAQEHGADKPQAKPSKPAAKGKGKEEKEEEVDEDESEEEAEETNPPKKSRADA